MTDKKNRSGNGGNSHQRDSAAELAQLHVTAAQYQQMLSKLSFDATEKNRLLERIAGTIGGTSSEAVSSKSESAKLALIRKAYEFVLIQATTGLADAIYEMRNRIYALRARKNHMIASNIVRIESDLFDIASDVWKLHRSEKMSAIGHAGTLVQRLVEIEKEISLLEKNDNERRSWGNPRHHFIALIISVVVLFAGVPVNLKSEEMWHHYHQAFPADPPTETRDPPRSDKPAVVPSGPLRRHTLRLAKAARRCFRNSPLAVNVSFGLRRAEVGSGAVRCAHRTRAHHRLRLVSAQAGGNSSRQGLRRTTAIAFGPALRTPAGAPLRAPSASPLSERHCSARAGTRAAQRLTPAPSAKAALCSPLPRSLI